jgi:hypothetical protein
MWLLSLILLGACGYIFTVLGIFCLLSPGRGADEREDETLELISQVPRDSTKMMKTSNFARG